MGSRYYGAMRQKRDEEVRQATKFVDGMTCHYCARTLDFPRHSRDHVIPRILGGQDEISNIVACCKQCNKFKSEFWTNCSCDFCFATITRHQKLGVVKPAGLDRVEPRYRVRLRDDGTCIRATEAPYLVDPVTFKPLAEKELCSSES